MQARDSTSRLGVRDELQLLASSLLIGKFVAFISQVFFLSKRTEMDRFLSFVDFSVAGPAPDQYRILPHLAIEAARGLYLTSGAELESIISAIHLVTTILLGLGFYLFQRTYRERKDIPVFRIVLFLAIVYPISMHRGFKHTTPMVFLLASAFMALLAAPRRKWSEGLAVILRLLPDLPILFD